MSPARLINVRPSTHKRAAVMLAFEATAQLRSDLLELDVFLGFDELGCSNDVSFLEKQQ